MCVVYECALFGYRVQVESPVHLVLMVHQDHLVLMVTLAHLEMMVVLDRG